MLMERQAGDWACAPASDGMHANTVILTTTVTTKGVNYVILNQFGISGKQESLCTHVRPGAH